MSLKPQMYRILFSIGKHILVHKIYFLCHNLWELLGNPWYQLSHLLAHYDLFSLGHFSIFQMFLGLQKNSEEVSKLCRFPHEAWKQYLTISGDLTKFDKISRKVLSLFWQKTRRAWFAWFYSVSAIYLVECSQLQKRCQLFSCNSCLRNAPNL